MTIRPAIPTDAAAIADVYIASFAAALPTVRRPHDDAETRGFIRDHVAETWVADDGGAVVAMMVLAPGWIEQLYVAPERRGEGIGGELLRVAKRRAEGALDLWTFQVNTPARAFYERHGFRAVELTDGDGNEEREPDVRYRWERSPEG